MAIKRIVLLSVLFVVVYCLYGCNNEKWLYENFDIDSYSATKVRKSTYVKKIRNTTQLVSSGINLPKANIKVIAMYLTVDRIYYGNGLYEILLSDSIGNQYEVVSLSCCKCTKDVHEKIKEGQSYEFLLVPQYNIPVDARGIEITWIITIGDYQVRPAHLLNGEIYMAQNLCGLDYLGALETYT